MIKALPVWMSFAILSDVNFSVKSIQLKDTIKSSLSVNAGKKGIACRSLF